MEIKFVDEDVIKITIAESIYSLDVLHKCFYWYGNEFSVDIEKTTNDLLLVTLKVKNNKLKESDIVALSEKIRTDLIDFKLRDIVTKETANIRDLLIAKAFSNHEIGDPNSEISDPVGFSPQ